MTENGGFSPGNSTIADDNMTTHPSSPVRADPDPPRSTIQHMLGTMDSRSNTPSASRQNDVTEDEGTPYRTFAATPTNTTTASKRKTPMAGFGGGDGEAESSKKKQHKDKDQATPGGAGNMSSYSGNKVRHLKKDDGEPLWRKDIQYDFLKLVFENDQEVFTNSYETDQVVKQTFANLYIDAMARSSKTSKILRDKLLTEHEPAKNMAMVCLLVNLGRMNTTLNCKATQSIYCRSV